MSESTKSTRPLRHYTSAERKAMPLYSGVLRYFPDALMAVSRQSKGGNDKHNPGQPLHWARDKSTDHEDCIARHLLTPDVIDPETGETELVAEVWRSLAALQLQEEKRLIKIGIQPLRMITAAARATSKRSRGPFWRR